MDSSPSHDAILCFGRPRQARRQSTGQDCRSKPAALFRDGAFLEDFLSCILFGMPEGKEFHNRTLHIRSSEYPIASAPANLDAMILSDISNDDTVSRRTMAERHHVSEKTIERHLKKLGFVFEGSAKTGHWVQSSGCQKPLSGNRTGSRAPCRRGPRRRLAGTACEHLVLHAVYLLSSKFFRPKSAKSSNFIQAFSTEFSKSYCTRPLGLF